jgi:signal transduction histidine kinase
MTDAVARPGGRFASWTLRRRVGGWFLTLVVLLVIAFAIVLWSTVRFKDKGDEILDHWQPAASTANALVTDLVNQETGVRGFVLGKQEQFLQPYHRYSAQQRVHEAQLRKLLSSSPQLMADLDALIAQADRWRTDIAEKYIAKVRARQSDASNIVADLAGKRDFDRIRVRAATLQRDIGAIVADLKGQRRGAVLFCIIATLAAAALTLGSKYVLWRGLQHQVLAPIDELGRQTRVVAAGAIEAPIAPGGPPEIARLGSDVESMRARIANELARAERARAVLAERGDELARSNADLEQFAYVASHDLSEPLRKVANFCQLLERQYGDKLDDKAKQYIDFAVDGAKRMQVLIADLLAFSRVGRSTETFVPVDMDRVVTRAMALLEDRLASAGAEVVRGPLPTLDGDETLLTALLQNLIGNAVKYRSTERTPRIEIGAVKQDGQWLFTVADNGIGIDRQYAERIFTIFQRLHLRDKYGGTGIGLALCRKIVEFHRGKIWLAESEGPGATFAFLVPEHAQIRSDPTSDPLETADAN